MLRSIIVRRCRNLMPPHLFAAPLTNPAASARKLAEGMVHCEAPSRAMQDYPAVHQALIPAPGVHGHADRGWPGQDAEGPPDVDRLLPYRRIFCNRTLDLSSMEAIGFDMDYTLAQYKPETFEHLAYSQTVDKLTTKFGYPAELRAFAFDWQYMMRGLTIDKRRGNVIKVDRHKYVKIAYHGLAALNKADRQAAYASGTSRQSFDSDDFTTIDTLFSLAEAYLFMQIVEIKDTLQHSMLNEKPYKDIYRDIRGAVDLCHRDGSLKTKVAADPGKYIHQDDKLKSLLEMYRTADRKVFLATNSLWAYTHVVMNFLIDGKEGRAKTTDWLKYFDIVVTGCGKPGFFSDGNLLFAVNPDDGTLCNTDNGAPILPVDKADMPSKMPSTLLPTEVAQSSKVFQGGSVSDLHELLGVTNATSVLYVGDHIFGDILKSKKTMGWRTMLIVPELQMELQHATECETTQKELAMLRRVRDEQDDRMHRLQAQLDVASAEGGGSEGAAARIDLAALDKEHARLMAMHRDRLKAHHDKFHPIWGQMLKTGYQNSMYASLMERFACLYTSHVCNLCLYSPFMKFRGRVDVMAHEQTALSDASFASLDDALALGDVPDVEVLRHAQGAAARDGGSAADEAAR